MFKGNPDKILVVLSAGLGDFIIAIPALKALRRRFPESKITLLVSSKVLDYAGSCPWTDHVLAFDGFRLFSIPGVLRLARQFPALLKLRRERLGLALNLYEIGTLTGMAKMWVLFKLLNAAVTAGRDTRGRGFFFDLRISEEDGDKKNQGDYYADIIAALGGEVVPREKSELWTGSAAPEIDAFLRGLKRKEGSPLIGINPGGARASRYWLPERFAGVADLLAEKYGASIVVTGGPGEESMAAAVASAMRRKPAVCAGRLSFAGTLELVKRMDLLITTHSSLTHAANAFGVPFVVLVGISDFVKDGPYMPEKGSYIAVGGSPSEGEDENLPSRSMAAITVAEVTAAAEALLSGGGRSAG